MPTPHKGVDLEINDRFWFKLHVKEAIGCNFRALFNLLNAAYNPRYSSLIVLPNQLARGRQKVKVNNFLNVVLPIVVHKRWKLLLVDQWRQLHNL